MHKLHDKTAFISDMDGVIYHGNNLLPGAIEFINWLKENNKKYLILTNSSERTDDEQRRSGLCSHRRNAYVQL